MPPKTLQELSICPEFTLVFAGGESSQRAKLLKKVRERALEVSAGSDSDRDPRVPILPTKRSPFLRSLKIRVEQLQQKLEARGLHIRGDGDHNLVHPTDYHNRDEQQQHEDATRRSAFQSLILLRTPHSH